jgi:hypothetical protein
MFLCSLGLCPLAIYRLFRSGHDESSSMTGNNLHLSVTILLADTKLDIPGPLDMFECQGGLVKSTR